MVVLDLNPLIREVATTLGNGSASGADSLIGSAAQQLDAVPAGSGRLVIMRASQLRTAQSVVRAIRDLWLALPIAALVCLALAVALTRGWRSIALRWIGLCLLVVGIADLLARRILESRVVNALVTSHSVRPAGDAAWSIATSLLRDIAFGLIVLGVVVAAASLVVGRLGTFRGSE
jgi:hypothetical protein